MNEFKDESQPIIDKYINKFAEKKHSFYTLKIA